MDFIIDLLPSNSFNAIYVVVECLPKLVHFALCKKTISREEMARLFFDNVYQNHDLPDDIISNQAS